VINVSKLKIPEEPPKSGLNYLLKANRYEAHRNWVRFTSDTAESMLPDTKGDIPPDLMRIVGALPEKMVVIGNHIFVTMTGSGEVQELEFNPEAAEPSDILTPVRNFGTGGEPFGIVAGVEGSPSDGLLFVANFYGSSLSVIDRKTGASRELPTDPALYKLLPQRRTERRARLGRESDSRPGISHRPEQGRQSGRGHHDAAAAAEEFVGHPAVLLRGFAHRL